MIINSQETTNQPNQHYVIAGIDYSLTSPSITIYNTLTHTYKFISLFDTSSVKDWTKSKRYTNHQLLSHHITTIPYTRVIPKSQSYIINQQCKVRDAVNISSIITNNLEYIIGNQTQSTTNQSVIIGIEGFSYNSHSSSYIDLIMYQSILRQSICDTFGYQSLYIISPTEIKKTMSGNGNADKLSMINSFISNRLNDTDLLSTDLYKTLCKLQSTNNLNIKHLKPFDDLVDSYGCVRSVYNTLFKGKE